MYVKKSQTVSLLHFFGTMGHFPKEKKSKIMFFLKKTALRFLSLRYSADFRRSRFVLKNIYQNVKDE